MSQNHTHNDHSIWLYAFGYFICYAPYSALTKMISQGSLPGMERKISGFELLPLSTIASLIAMFVFLSVKRWWRHAGHRSLFGISLPCPSRWTFLSGLTTAAIIGTTTLAYTFSGVSIVFMMLLMRGGVLILAPIVDFVSRRKVKWFSWTALGLSLCALTTAFLETTNYALTLVAAADVAIYLTSYFIRLRFMSRLAKSNDRETTIRYFVEEQMVATPAIVTALALFAFLGTGKIADEVRRGFTDIWASGGVTGSFLVGLLSQGTGVFGGLILLDGRENTFCVPVNRASSVIAGVLASLGLWYLGRSKPMAWSEWIGVVLMTGAIVVLALPSVLKKMQKQSQAAPG